MATAEAELTVLEMLERIPVHDVDTHVVELPDLWTSRLSEKRWGDALPRVVRDDKNVARWLVGGKPAMRTSGESLAKLQEKRMGAADADAGADEAKANAKPPHPYYDEMSYRGGFDPKARLEWMDLHGIYSQVLYPNLVGFFVKAFVQNLEPELRNECMRAYNDFQTEFCSVAPDRLIPLANLPWWDLDEAVKELHRCVEMGHKGVNFGWRFEELGFPRLRDEHWDPLLKAVEETGLSINFHVGMGGDPDDDPAMQFDTRLDTLDRVKFAAQLFSGNIACIGELIMSGLCRRYPTLKFVSVESGVGFLPYLVEALDWQFLNQNLWKRYPDWLLPSEYFRRQIYGCFWFEKGVSRFADLYPDNFMFETDFNHPTSLTPAESFPYVKGPRETIVENLGDLPEELLRKLLHDNAARVYGLT